MACGDRLRYLVVTATGLNLENPYDDVPTFNDFEEWRSLARRLLLLAQQFHDALGAVEEDKTPGNFSLWNAANEVRSRAVGTYEELPSFFSSDVASDIASAQASIFDALCVIEMSEDGIVSLGGVAPVLPGAPPARDNDGILTGTKNAAVTVLLVGGGIAALLLLARRRR